MPASPSCSRQRLLKKLGLGRGAGAGTRRPLINARRAVARRGSATASPSQQRRLGLVRPAAAQPAAVTRPTGRLQLQPCDLDDAWPSAAAEPASRRTFVAQHSSDQHRAGSCLLVTDNRYDHRPAFAAPQQQPPACAARPGQRQPPVSDVQPLSSGVQPASSPQPWCERPREQALSKGRAGQPAARPSPHKRAAPATEPAPQPTAKRRRAYDIMGAQQLLAIAGKGRQAAALVGRRSAAAGGCDGSRAACRERHSAASTAAAPQGAARARQAVAGRLAQRSGSIGALRKEAAGVQSGVPRAVGLVLVESDIFA